MITLLFHGRSVGPVCRLIAQHAPDKIKIACDRDQSGIDPDDLVIRWDSTRPTKALECQLAKTVKVSRNKTESRRLLGPLAPPTYFGLQDIPGDIYPVIVRPHRHHAGANFNVCEGPDQVKALVRANGVGKQWYASPIIPKASEYRVYVFQGYAVSVSKRICDDPEQVAWNVALGARMVKITRKNWPINVVKTAIKAAKALDLNWGAIDLAISTDGSVVVFEANTAPGLQPNARSLPLIAKAFTWAGEHLDFADEVPDDGKTWKAYIHPALRKP